MLRPTHRSTIGVDLIKNKTKTKLSEKSNSDIRSDSHIPDYQMIVDNLPEGVLVVDAFNDILYANSTVLAYLQKDEADIIGTNIGFGPVPGEVKTIILPEEIDPARQRFEAGFRHIYWAGDVGYIVTLQPQERANSRPWIPGKADCLYAPPYQPKKDEFLVRFDHQGIILEAVDISPGYFISVCSIEKAQSVFTLLPEEHGIRLKENIDALNFKHPMKIFNVPSPEGHQVMQEIQMILQSFYDSAGNIREYLLLGSRIPLTYPFSTDVKTLNSVIENASQGIAFADMDGKFIGANQTFFAMLGYHTRDVLGNPINLMLSSVHAANYFQNIANAIVQQGSWQGECWLQHKDQHVFPAEVRAIAISHSDPSICYYAIYVTDKSELKLVENNLRHLALHDPLTNLPNRTLLHERLFQSVRTAHKSNELFAVLHLDLDGFKVINNTFGHSHGDLLLQKVSERLMACIHKEDLLARMGGDEFAIISYPSDNEGMVPASVTAQKIIDQLTKPYLINDQELFITASIGISLYPGDGETAIALLKNADIAMYRAKELGKNNFQFYSEELNRRVLQRLDMENHLRHALHREEFNLLYQPIVEARTRRIMGVEALLRWDHTTLGRIMPDDFIPLAEQTGLIVEIGKWVIQTACRQQLVLEKSGYTPIQMAVNISGRQLEEDEFVAFIRETLDETGMQPSMLVLEITESLLMEDIEKNSKKLAALRKLGVKISIDDFGTGYSSLHSLVNLPIDSLKIDKSFVSALEENPHGLSLVKGVISIGHNLDMEIIAEGVEKNTQASLLEIHACDLMQGYYFGCPMNFEELCRLIDPLLK